MLFLDENIPITTITLREDGVLWITTDNNCIAIDTRHKMVEWTLRGDSYKIVQASGEFDDNLFIICSSHINDTTLDLSIYADDSILSYYDKVKDHKMVMIDISTDDFEYYHAIVGKFKKYLSSNRLLLAPARCALESGKNFGDITIRTIAKESVVYKFRFDPLMDYHTKVCNFPVADIKTGEINVDESIQLRKNIVYVPWKYDCESRNITPLNHNLITEYDEADDINKAEEDKNVEDIPVISAPRYKNKASHTGMQQLNLYSPDTSSITHMMDEDFVCIWINDINHNALMNNIFCFSEEFSDYRDINSYKLILTDIDKIRVKKIKDKYKFTFYPSSGEPVHYTINLAPYVTVLKNNIIIDTKPYYADNGKILPYKSIMEYIK